jgi:uncharacterized protein (TIGR02145 family)
LKEIYFGVIMNYKFLVLSLFLLSFIFGCGDNNSNPPPVNYETVTIGTQVWMLKNLDVDHYRNGDPIQQVSDPDVWKTLTTGACCYYEIDPANGAIYGKLYNWYAVNDPRGLAPRGWHVPSDAEWTTLSDYLGGESIAGGKMKETGTTHWMSPNKGASNSSSFSALPGGNRGSNDVSIRGSGFWWSSTEYNGTKAWSRVLYYYDTSLLRYYNCKVCGFSVRCVKDK